MNLTRKNYLITQQMPSISRLQISIPTRSMNLGSEDRSNTEMGLSAVGSPELGNEDQFTYTLRGPEHTKISYP